MSFLTKAFSLSVCRLYQASHASSSFLLILQETSNREASQSALLWSWWTCRFLSRDVWHYKVAFAEPGRSMMIDSSGSSITKRKSKNTKLIPLQGNLVTKPFCHWLSNLRTWKLTIYCMHFTLRSSSWTHGIKENTGVKQVDVNHVRWVVCIIESYFRFFLGQKWSHRCCTAFESSLLACSAWRILECRGNN